MEIAKFKSKFNNQMFSDFFNNYFTKLDNVYNYNTRQKTRTKFFQYSVAFESKRKILHHIGLKVWKIYQKNFVIAHFQLLKNILKQMPC